MLPGQEVEVHEDQLQANVAAQQAFLHAQRFVGHRAGSISSFESGKATARPVQGFQTIGRGACRPWAPDQQEQNSCIVPGATGWCSTLPCTSTTMTSA